MFNPYSEDNQFDLDRDFPLGDGTADTGVVVTCPYCAAAVEIAVDAGGGSAQDYVEDCEVCCRPWRVRLRYDSRGHAHVEVHGLNE